MERNPGIFTICVRCACSGVSIWSSKHLAARGSSLAFAGEIAIELFLDDVEPEEVLSTDTNAKIEATDAPTTICTRVFVPFGFVLWTAVRETIRVGELTREDTITRTYRSPNIVRSKIIMMDQVRYEQQDIREN
eukprot:m.142101 g.142101  ORF g.142101 m.142101 type:complete len:134 (+) comp30231_c3_seq3:1308-1709(+)